MPIGPLGLGPAPLQVFPRGSQRPALRVRVGAVAVGARMTRVLAVGANTIAAMTAASGQDLTVPISVQNTGSTALTVTATALLYLSQGTPGSQGQVTIGSAVYPIAGYLAVGDQPGPTQTIAAGGMYTFQFAATGLAAASVPEGLYVAVSAAADGQALPGSPLQAWTNPFLTVGATGGSSAFTFGSAANAALSPGGMLQMEGASVTATGDWWTLTVSALVGGSVLQTTQVTGQGSASGLAYTLGPLNTAGSVTLQGSLALYSTGSKTTQLPGSPVSATSGVVATVQAVTVTPTAISGFAVSLSGTTATVTWGANSTAQFYEFQVVDSDGSVDSLLTSQFSPNSGSALDTDDPNGNPGLFFSGVGGAITLPGGFSGTLRVRGCQGEGPDALVGPWSSSAVQVPNLQPNLVVTGVSATASQSVGANYVFTTYITITNQGTAPSTSLTNNPSNTPGNVGYSAAIFGPTGTLFGEGGNSGEILLAPGESMTAALGWSVPGAYGEPFTVYFAINSQAYVDGSIYRNKVPSYVFTVTVPTGAVSGG